MFFINCWKWWGPFRSPVWVQLLWTFCCLHSQASHNWWRVALFWWNVAVSVGHGHGQRHDYTGSYGPYLGGVSILWKKESINKIIHLDFCCIFPCGNKAVCKMLIFIAHAVTATTLLPCRYSELSIWKLCCLICIYDHCTCVIVCLKIFKNHAQ